MCKSRKQDCNISICDDCGYTYFHNNTCCNRNCPNCQEVLKKLWIDKRKSEVIDTPYFHVVFTVPSELNALIYYSNGDTILKNYTSNLKMNNHFTKKRNTDRMGHMLLQLGVRCENEAC